MYSTNDLQKLVVMLNFLGIIAPGVYPQYSVVLGAGANAAPGVAGTLLASNGAAANPSFQTLATLGIQAALGYTPAHAGANIDITSLASPALAAATATTAPKGTNNTKVATTAFVVNHEAIPNILDFGGDNTGVSDNAVAFAAALAASPTDQAAIMFPPGTYAFASGISFTLPNNSSEVSIFGCGSENTKLVWAAGGGLTINFKNPSNSAHIRGLTLLTGTTATGNGLNFVQSSAVANPANSALSDITDVTIRGSDAYAGSKYWANGINLTSVSNVNFNGVTIVGTSTFLGRGLIVSGSASAIPVVFNFNGCTFNYLNVGAEYGAYSQGVTFNQCNFTAANTGILTSGSNLAQLTVTGCQFNCNNVGINEAINVPGSQIVGNLFIVPNTALGINLPAGGMYSVSANNFQGLSTANTNGIVVNNSTAAGIVTGNTFLGLTTGVNLQASCTNANVQSNAYTGCTNKVVNSGGASNTVGGGSL
ncbi:hypothetical protein FSO04_24180 [Paraburkholderia madseniana]|uniref:Pectate lyase superfamily protein domain-containing protein n=1 Tax=Paraburkholderia madseniana TaxID=2599607 RepID=A0A6N6W9K4_9BURK|nr:glycosyl hydrolase family 28-related protein [Paraburkholderia madseniana]KAE8757322.1 hypothetical protein FSO04_24180 [Paraburkholderia madseniana]